MKVYVVTTGQYSDYRIERIFATRKEAEKFKVFYEKVNCYDTASIEEWPLGYTYPHRRLFSARCGRYWSGGWTDDYFEVNEIDPESDVKEFNTQHRPGAGVGPNNAWIFRQVMKAKDLAHAEKIFRDNVARFVAQQEGL